MKHTRTRAALLRGHFAIVTALAAPSAFGQSATDPMSADGVRGLERLALRLEASGGTMLPEHQRRLLGYDAGHLQLHGRLAVSVLDALSLQVSAGHGRFFSTRAGLEPGLTLPVTAGARVDPRRGRVRRLGTDAHGGYVLTGDEPRFGLAAGAGCRASQRAGGWGAPTQAGGGYGGAPIGRRWPGGRGAGSGRCGEAATASAFHSWSGCSTCAVRARPP